MTPTTRTMLARQALEAAQVTRQQRQRSVLDPLCIYDVVSESKVDLWFQDNSSLEGMYAQTPAPRIIIGAKRPCPRQRYTCAHELGHHVFNHGTRIDEFHEEAQNTCSDEPEEFLAQAYAGFLLMPKLAIEFAFRKRGWKPTHTTPEQVYTLSCLFGVGYEAILHHMCRSLGIISEEHRNLLSKKKLGAIRAEMTESVEVSQPVVVADTFWKGRPIDLEVGDLLLAPSNAQLSGTNLSMVRTVKRGTLWQALTPGTSQIVTEDESWAAFIRVAKKDYAGRNMFRHKPTLPDDE